LVLMFLGADPHSLFSYTAPFASDQEHVKNHVGTQDPNTLNPSVLAVDTLMQWTIEFLQRRQDAGARPPWILGPRLWAEENFLPVRTMEFAQEKTEFFLHAEGLHGLQTENKGQLISFKFVGLDGLVLQKPISMESLEKVDLSLQNAEGEKTQKPTSWDIFEKTTSLPNPVVFKGLPLLQEQVALDLSAQEHLGFISTIPLLKAYPYLLFLLLFCIFLEHCFWLFHRTKKK